MMPNQRALSVDFSSSFEYRLQHGPFTERNVYINSIIEEFTVIPSAKKPKKITFVGSDSLQYDFLLKADDDLRKDLR